MLDAIGIVSRNPKATIAFYQEFGLEFIESGGADHYEATMGNGLRLMVDSIELMKKLVPSWQLASGTAIVLCFKQKTTDEVDALVKKLDTLGHTIIKPPFDAFWGQRYASVADPDGNQIDIFADK